MKKANIFVTIKNNFQYIPIIFGEIFWLFRYIPIILASLFLIWLFDQGLSTGISQAARDFLDLIVQQKFEIIGYLFDWAFEYAIAAIQHIMVIDITLQEHARYAFTLLSLKLIQDAGVDIGRVWQDFKVRCKNAGQFTVWNKLKFALTEFPLKSKWLIFTFIEFMLGLFIAIIASAAVSYYPFSGKDLSFAMTILIAVSVYELVKTGIHVWIDIYNKGWRSNVRRYFLQFWLATTALCFVSLFFTLLVSSVVQAKNDSVLCTFVFIIILAVWQYMSAAYTFFSARKRLFLAIFNRLLEMGQIKIGTRIVVTLLTMIGWIIVASIYTTIEPIIGQTLSVALISTIAAMLYLIVRHIFGSSIFN